MMSTDQYSKDPIDCDIWIITIIWKKYCDLSNI